MEWQIILMTIITFSAVITVLSFAFNLILSPVKNDIQNLKVGQGKLENRLEKIEGKLEEILKLKS